LPAAAGISLAAEGSLVVCLASEAALLLGLQGLLAISQMQVPVLVIALSNGGSVSLQLEAASRYPSPTTGDIRPLLKSFRTPVLRFDRLAHAMDIEASYVTSGDMLRPSLWQAVATVDAKRRPLLVEVLLEDDPQVWSRTWQVRKYFPERSPNDP
jgi:thiamine pyrophosphate-dependent acetolactate synthase large subunit-like protein